MNLEEIFNFRSGHQFLYQGKPAEAVWIDKVEFLISKGDPKGDPKANPPTSDCYFRNTAIFFKVEGLSEGITLVSYWPRPKEVVMEEFQPVPPNFKLTPAFKQII